MDYRPSLDADTVETSVILIWKIILNQPKTAVPPAGSRGRTPGQGHGSKPNAF